MAGWDLYAGKSNNAVDAERCGVVPLSHITGKRLKLNYPTGFLKYLAEYEIGSSEWHHTSKYYNTTDYYDTDLIIDFFEESTEEEINQKLEEYKVFLAERRELKKEKEAKLNNTVVRYCFLEYFEWVGTRRHPRPSNMRYDLIGVVKDDWAVSKGGSRKNIYGNTITHRQFFDFFNKKIPKKELKTISVKRLKPNIVLVKNKVVDFTTDVKFVYLDKYYLSDDENYQKPKQYKQMKFEVTDELEQYLITHNFINEDEEV